MADDRKIILERLGTANPAMLARVKELRDAGTPYLGILPIIKDEFGVALKYSQIRSYFAKQGKLGLRNQVITALMDRIKLSTDAAEQVRECAARLLPTATEASLGIIAQQFFDAAAHPGANIEDLKDIAETLLHIRSEDRKGQELELLRHRVQRQSVGLFIQWFADKQAREIIEGTLPHDAKTEALGQIIFGDDWAPSDPAPLGVPASAGPDAQTRPSAPDESGTPNLSQLGARTASSAVDTAAQ